MRLEIMLREVSQTLKSNYIMFSLGWGVWIEIQSVYEKNGREALQREEGAQRGRRGQKIVMGEKAENITGFLPLTEYSFN